MTDSLLGHLGEHLIVFFAGSTGAGLLAHLVNTFPVPENKYGKWLLGSLQWLLGQRTNAAQTMTGKDAK